MDLGVWKSFSGPDLCGRCVSDIIAHPQHIFFFASGSVTDLRFLVPISNQSAGNADRWSACDQTHQNVGQSLPDTMRCVARAISASITSVIELRHFSKNACGCMSTSFSYQKQKFRFCTFFYIKCNKHNLQFPGQCETAPCSSSPHTRQDHVPRPD